MRSLTLRGDKSKAPVILCIGAHSDDIEIGCGGTILGLSEDYPECRFYWTVFSAEGARADEARRAADLFAGQRIAGGTRLHSFRDGFFPYLGAQIKEEFEILKREVSPDLILTTSRRDSHQDHRLLGELTWNTFRDHLILEYEIPKYDGDMGNPNVFVPLTKEACERKIEYLMSAFPSQQPKNWFEPETFRSLLRIRGMECNSPSGYAEAFYSRKIVL